MSLQCNTNNFLLLYGSQTGQAKAIAEEIHSKASCNGLTANLYCFSLTDKKFNIAREDCVVIIVSTTGDGEPPDTVLKFWRRIKKRTLPDDYLKQLHYTLLALGDSNYNNFCNCGNAIDKRLQELGASKFYPTGYGDDAVGLETTVDPWIDGLWLALKNHLCLNDGTGTLPLPLGNRKMILHNHSQTQLENISDNCVDAKVTNIKSYNKTFSTSTMSMNDSSATVHSLRTANSDNSFASSTFVGNKDNLTDKAGTAVLSTELVSNSFLRLFSPLNINNLTLPKIPASFISFKYLPQEEVFTPTHSEIEFPSAASSVVTATVVNARQLTSSPDVKNAVELTIGISRSGISFLPGDSFGFLCFNPEDEVQLLLERLGVVEHADVPCKITVSKLSTRQQHMSMSHLPLCSTLRQIFLKYCEIRAVPKKALLCKLAEYTSDPLEKKQLLYLCSREGTNLYTSYIRGPRLCLLDLLCVFPCCMPTPEAIIENLPRLQPRFYSAISVPSKEDLFKIVFNVVQIKEGQGRFFCREGICTGWLSKLSQTLQSHQKKDKISGPSLVDDMKKLSLKENAQIEIYKRRNNTFYPPNDITIPIIMIGPGTGVAPFVGFLLYRKQQIQSASDSINAGDIWLFYGCRYKEKDFLYREELEELHESKVLTHLVVSFSRDINAHNLPFFPKYVQDNIKHFSSDIIDLIVRGAKIYVCGDARCMAKDVFQAFIESYQKVKALDKDIETILNSRLADDEKVHLYRSRLFREGSSQCETDSQHFKPVQHVDSQLGAQKIGGSKLFFQFVQLPHEYFGFHRIPWKYELRIF